MNKILKINVFQSPDEYCSESMTERNLIDYTVLSDVSDGARLKYWVQKNNETFLYKESRVHPSGEFTKEHTSEYLAHLIAETLSIPSVDILLAENAVFSKKMYDAELKSFLDFSEELSHSFHLSNLATYNISTLLSETNVFRDNIIDMLLFDALIGNSDRHPGNYCYSDERGFYPLFDNGSSLCAFIEETKITSILRDSMRFNALCETKSKPVLRDNQKITHHQLVAVLKTQFPKQFSNFQERLTPDVLGTLDSVCISEERHELLTKFLQHRMRWFYE